MGKVVVVTSGKGGVGKTTILANLGIMLATNGKMVCLVDADIGLNNLDVVIGVENKIVYDLIDCIEGRCRPEQALIQTPFLDRLFVLPCCKLFDGKRVPIEKFSDVIGEIKNNFDYVLIDCPAGIGSGFYMSVEPSDCAIVVVTPTISSIRDADKVIQLLKANKTSDIKLVVNRISRSKVIKNEMIDADQIEELLGVEIVGIIPESDELNMYNSFLTKGAEFEDIDIKYAFGIFCKNFLTGGNEKFNYLAKRSWFLNLFKRC